MGHQLPKEASRWCIPAGGYWRLAVGVPPVLPAPWGTSPPVTYPSPRSLHFTIRSSPTSPTWKGARRYLSPRIPKTLDAIVYTYSRINKTRDYSSDFLPHADPATHSVLRNACRHPGGTRTPPTRRKYAIVLSTLVPANNSYTPSLATFTSYQHPCRIFYLPQRSCHCRFCGRRPSRLSSPRIPATRLASELVLDLGLEPQTTAMTLHTENPVLAPLPTAPRQVMADAKQASLGGSPRMSTPPPPSDRGRLECKQKNVEGISHRRTRSSARMSEGSRPNAFDVDAVDSALRKEFGRPHRESTPSASPHRKRQRINGDR